MDDRPFPFADRPRLWGVAVSHYQVEGNDPCDWSEWEEDGRTREACGSAAGSWQRYEEDATLAATLGANAFRFSVSWSRVEPRPGEYDHGAISRYVRLVDHLQQMGVEPVVTLFHYTHPQWFHATTPWTSPRSIDRFVAFAATMARAFGKSVRMYTIFNEPLVFLLAGYLDAQIPPGVADVEQLRDALEHVLIAHAQAAEAIRDANPAVAIGVAHNFMSFAPQRWWHPLDRLLSLAAHRFYNVALPEAFITGRWKLLLPPATLFAGSHRDLRNSIDFLGVNFYSRLHLRCPGRARLTGDFRYLDRSGYGLTDTGWEIVPEQFEQILMKASSFGLPLVITENGIADATDERRRLFLRTHFDAMQRARARGADVAGYLHWSLLDNFEWLEGFAPRFGLVEVDRVTMERRPRPSAAQFGELGRVFLSK